MLKLDYFILAYRNGMVYNRGWLLRAFTIQFETKNPGAHTRVGDFIIEGKTYKAVTEQGLVDIEGAVADGNTTLFGVREPITVMPGVFPIIVEKTDTFYSTLVSNLIIFEYPFKDAIPYQNRRLTGKYIDALTAAALKEDRITVQQYRDHTRSISLMTALMTACVPAATEKTIMPAPGIGELRDKLVEQYKDSLDDPAVIEKIERELIKHYQEYLKGDISEGFYLKSKAINVSLKRTHMIFGGEPRLDDTSRFDLATRSLREGWDIKNLPMMVNSLRMGSYNRGSETALGGELAKLSARIFQNTKLTDEDCGSTVGIPFPITIYNHDEFSGRYRVVGGKSSRIDGDLKSEIGTTVHIRSPQTCKAPDGNYCPVCMGDRVGQSGVGLGSQASAVGSNFLALFLSLMHGRELKTATYKYRDALQ